MMAKMIKWIHYCKFGENLTEVDPMKLPSTSAFVRETNALSPERCYPFNPPPLGLFALIF